MIESKRNTLNNFFQEVSKYSHCDVGVFSLFDGCEWEEIQWLCRNFRGGYSLKTGRSELSMDKLISDLTKLWIEKGWDIDIWMNWVSFIITDVFQEEQNWKNVCKIMIEI